MNLVALLTKQGLTARTLDPPEKFSEFQKAFLTCPLPTRRRKSSAVSIVSDPDESDDEPTTPPSSPTHGVQLQTSALLHQVMQRLVGLSKRTFESFATTLTSSHDRDDDADGEQRLRQTITLTPPSSPTFDGLVAPTPNTALHAIKTSTFFRVSSLNPFTKQSMRQTFTARSPAEMPSTIDELLKGGVGGIPRL